jgi:type IV secretory pathway TraG/TraD family ATPase VirD4
MHADDTMPPNDGTSGGPLGNARWADPEYIAERYAYREGAIWLGRCPHDPERAIGYEDNRHVFLCAETRSGKGRAFLVNNQVLWPGSLIAIDPKGEAVVTAAARRGPGNAHCDGLGQEVYILDPSGIDLPPELDRFRAHFNPLAALRADDPQLIEKIDRVAKALCVVHEGEAKVWDEKARDLVAAVIAHLITAPKKDIEGHGLTRDLLSLRELILAGNLDLATRTDEYQRARAAAEGKTAKRTDALEALLLQMTHNPACNREIALAAHDLLRYMRGHENGFESVRDAAKRQLAFLKGYGIRKTVTATGVQDDRSGAQKVYPRTFRVEELKDARISVFLCVKRQDYPSMGPWLRAMIEVLIDGMMERDGLGKSGRRVLFCIDEFANLGPLEAIEQAVNDIASAGVKLMLAVQRLDDLKKHYGETWENFIASAGAQIWFGASSNTTTEYLEQALGQTQVTLYARGVSTNRGTSSAETLTESYSHTHSLSKTHGSATSKGTSHTQGQGGSKTSSYGTTDGTSAGRNYGPHILFPPFERGTAYQRNRSTQRNTADGEQWSSQQSSNETNTENRAETTSDADTTTGGTSRTQQTTEGQSADLREQFHVRPLLLADEARRYLRPMEDNPNDPIAVQEDIREHPAYPGLALIRLAGEPDPFFVRKANHDQDPFFVRKFSPNPAFRFVPLDEQPLFGWQITPEFFYELRLDADMSDPDDKDAVPRRSILADRDRCPVVLDLAEDWKPGDRIEAGQPVLAVKPDDPTAWLTVLPPERIETPKSFKVMANGWRRGQPNGTSIMLLRDDVPISVEQRRELTQAFLGAVNWWARTEIAERKRRKADEVQSLQAEVGELSSRLSSVRRKIEQSEAAVKAWEKDGPAISKARNELRQIEEKATRTIDFCKRNACDGPLLRWLYKNSLYYPVATVGIFGGTLPTIWIMVLLVANALKALLWVQAEPVSYSFLLWLPITGLISFAYFYLHILDRRLIECEFNAKIEKARAEFAQTKEALGKNIESDYENARKAMMGLQAEARRLLGDLDSANQRLAEKEAELSPIVGYE